MSGISSYKDGRIKQTSSVEANTAQKHILCGNVQLSHQLMWAEISGPVWANADWWQCFSWAGRAWGTLIKHYTLGYSSTLLTSAVLYIFGDCMCFIAELIQKFIWMNWGRFTSSQHTGRFHRNWGASGVQFGQNLNSKVWLVGANPANLFTPKNNRLGLWAGSQGSPL